MRRLTVVQLLPALEGGGVERSTLEIAEALVGAGHRAIVVSKGGRLLPRLDALGAEHITLDIGRKSPLVFRHVAALRRVFRDVEADIVHARSRLPAWLARLALRGMGAGRQPGPHFVTTAHGLEFAVTLQRDHGPRRAGDLRVAERCAIICCGSTRHRSAAGWW